MIVRSFPTGGLIHKINIEIAMSELQDLINESKHAIESSKDPSVFRQLGKLTSHLCEYYERTKAPNK